MMLMQQDYATATKYAYQRREPKCCDDEKISQLFTYLHYFANAANIAVLLPVHVSSYIGYSMNRLRIAPSNLRPEVRRLINKLNTLLALLNILLNCRIKYNKTDIVKSCKVFGPERCVAKLHLGGGLPH